MVRRNSCDSYSEAGAVADEQIGYWRSYQTAAMSLASLGRGDSGGWVRVRELLIAQILRDKGESSQN